jgi:predicted DNA-binding transcriptional regulator AlpA
MTVSREQWLTLTDVCEELGIARSSLDAWRRDDRFPKFRKLPNGGLRLRRSELDIWTESLLAV